LSNAGRQALREYERQAERELIRPLLDWALTNPDPVARNAGMELAYVSRQMHKMKPWLEEELSFEGEAFFRRKYSRPPDLLSAYHELFGRFMRLLTILRARRQASQDPQVCFDARRASARLFNPVASPGVSARQTTPRHENRTDRT
jgi:hypothetical protein